ncbi:C2 domain-containing protein 2 [Pseudonaja textilis]|uniref:C2 domain-containing protein 2 n=1 Tax=Pseudonaja textilis TaxID=8673 RepID=UPI000EA9B29F|nr:C2 domain-containing protein 2 [Pseudonaja textilis]
MSWLACWLDELQRFSLLSLFTAALAVLSVYLVQYGLSLLRQGGGKPPPPSPSRPGLLPEDEGGSLFTWLLSLNSWRSEWHKAWIAALNKEAGLRENTCLFTFDEDAAHQNQELAVQGIINVVKSAEENVVSCNVIGNSFHFLVSVCQTAPLTGECQSYHVKLSPLHLQLKLSTKSEEDIQIKWSFIYSSETNMEVKPTNVQKDQTLGICTALETFKSVLQNLISCTSPVMILSTRSTDIKGIQKHQHTEYGLAPPKSRWEIPQKIMETKKAKILWDFQTHTEKQVLVNQPDMIVDKDQKSAVVIDTAVPSDSNIRKKQCEKLEKYQGLKEELKQM